MICPYCGKPMEKGFLGPGRQISGIPWLPDGARLPLNPFVATSAVRRCGGLLLADRFSSRNTLALTTWLCRDCGKGIFDIAEDRTVFGKEPEK